MSLEMKALNDEYSLNIFYGGDKRGRCLQVTTKQTDDLTYLPKNIQLTVEMAKALKDDLQAFIEYAESQEDKSC